MSSESLISREHNGKSDMLSFSIPESREDDVLVKIQKKKVLEPKVHTFRSFAIQKDYNGMIRIGSKSIHVSHLFEILKAHELISTLPISVDLGPMRFVDFDWHPTAYSGPRSGIFNGLVSNAVLHQILPLFCILGCMIFRLA
jgi:hypothetical protein